MSGPDPYESSFNESSAEQGFVKEPMDFWTEVEPFLYVGIIVTILGILVGFLFMRRRKRGSITLADLGVTVEPNCVRLPWEEIDMYHETKERLWELYGNNCEDNSWLATLNDNAKNMLKYRLMRRAVGVIDALHGVQTSRRAYFKMYSNKIIPESAWAGFQEAEANVSAEIEAAQQEASYMEPTHNSESVIQNAIKCWQQGGRDWGKSSNLMTVEDSIQQVQKQIKENYDPRDKMAELASKGMKGMGDALKEKGKGKGSAKDSGDGGFVVGSKSPSEPYWGWRQNPREVDITIELKPGTKRSDISVKIKSRSIEVNICGVRLLSGQLCHPIDPDGSTYTTDSKTLDISLEKAEELRWATLTV